MSKDNFGYKWMNDTKYKWEVGMGEISGFGGEYEECCRYMLIKGLEFIDTKKQENKDYNPRFQGIKNVYGIYTDDNKDAKELSDYVTRIPEEYFGEVWGPSGAMHQAVCSSLLWIMGNGWDKYKEAMKKSRNDNL